MKTLSYLYFCFALLIANNTTSQNLETLKNYAWESDPNYFEYNQELEELIGVKDKMIIDFEYDEDGRLLEYNLIHRAFILNSDEEIEAYNKLYLPTTSAHSEIIKINARVITKNGEINILDKDKILSSKNEETGKESKYYAYEGVVKGSVIEYYYLLKKSPSYSGKRVTIQDDYLINNYTFDLYAPLNLIFKLKVYNTPLVMVSDTSVTDKNHWQLNIKKVVGLEYESQSAYAANKMFFIYKLDQNTATNKYDLSSYSDIATNVYNRYYSKKTKTALKAIKQLINATACKTAGNKTQTIRAVEDYVKSTFYMVSQGDADLADISKIVTNKTASYSGIIKLYTAIFSALEIKHQIVLTSSRFKSKFDKNFESANFLTDYLIYFPSVKAYISPTSISSRLGFPMPAVTNSYGLFIKELNVNNMKTGIGKIKFIDPVAYDKNFDEMIIDINLDTTDINKSIVKFVRSTGGYYAINIQPYMSFFKAEEKSEIVDDYIRYLSQDITIINKTVFYDDAKYFGIEPFKVSSEFHLDPFIEKAGKSVILKVGKLIGPQQEMYQEKERILPIENEFNRNYHRVITINIPEKYTLKNAEDLNIFNDYVKDEETLMSFKSSYTFEKNVLTVTVDEYYKIINVKPELYNTYRKIINSAADFNKVSLVLD